MKSVVDIDTLLCYGATYKKSAKGEIIFSESADCRYYYQLVDGKVRWVNVDDNGREFVQKIVQQGESFGDMTILDGSPYVATAVAEVDSLLIRLPREIFLQMLRENPEIHFNFTKLMSERLRERFIILKEIASHDPERKIATIIDMYKSTSDNPHEGCDECNRTRIGLTRQEIADMTGLRVETVIRTIRHLHDIGKLRIQRGKVYC